MEYSSRENGSARNNARRIRMKKILRHLGMASARFFGMTLTDAHSGKPLGKVLLFPWRGKIHVIGLPTAVRPVFLPQQRVTYWKQEIGFCQHPTPDFRSQAGEAKLARRLPESSCRTEQSDEFERPEV